MQNNLGFKLIAVMDINNLKLFKAQGLKIIEELGKFFIHSDVNHKTERHEGFNAKKSTSSFFDPHTAPKDIEYQESSRAAVIHVSNILLEVNSPFKELCVVADPKMLGHFRQSLSNKLKKFLTKEATKDLMNHNIADIEKALFS